MKIQKKVIFGGLALSIVPLVVSGIIVSNQSVNGASEALAEAALVTLKAKSDAQAKNITNYFEMLEGVLKTQTSNPTVVSALGEFQASFSFPTPTNQMKTAVRQFYTNEFGAKYANKNPGVSPPLNQMLNGLDDDSWYLQYQYIAGNPAELGAKDELLKADDNTAYATVHGKYHRYIQSLLYQFNLYDIFIADATSGDIIYSVFKELDFSTSLKNGPYAQSGIGQAFQNALPLNAGEVYLTPFDAYQPSYADAASFMASPIQIDGQTQGVLIFQMPLDSINAMLNYDEKWLEVGMEETGMALLLGENGVLLNNPRPLVENFNQSFSDYVETAGGENSMLNRIRVNESAVGSKLYVPMVEGITDITLRDVVTPSGKNVFQAVMPFDVLGQSFYSMTEKQKTEALSAAHTLSGKIFASASMFILFVAIACGFIVSVFSKKTLKPLVALASRSQDLASMQGADLTQKLDDTSKDEIAEASNGLNQFFSRIANIVKSVRDTSAASEQLSQGLGAMSSDAMNDVEAQAERTTLIATATHEMTSSISEISQSAESAAGNASQAHTMMDETQAVFKKSLIAMEELNKEIGVSSDVVGRLQSRTSEIAKVLDVIRDIAEQTNLLALNAAIEAARAGEQGRGFAVVADEVRKLASRTQSSTVEVDEIIANLTQDAQKSVQHMSKSTQEATGTINALNETQNYLQKMSDNVQQIQSDLQQMAAAAEEQSSVTSDIASNAEELGQMSEHVRQRFYQMNESIQNLNANANELQNTVGVFKVS